MSRKELLWLSCREKACCTHYTVTPTAADLWRISRAFEMPPWEFTYYTDAPAGGDGAFALGSDERRYQMILAKQRDGPGATGPCAFLLRLPDGHAQCGLGVNRPTTCHTFPAALAGGVVCVGEHDGCTCRVWSEASLDEDEERPRLLQLERERHEHARMVGEWNQAVERDPCDRAYPEFCDFLMNRAAERYPAP